MSAHRYTKEEQAFMSEFVPGHSHKEIQDEFTKRFRWEIAISQVKSYIRNHHLTTGRTGRFEKGITAHNKGKKMSPEVYEKAKGTMFQKGHVPKNYKPVGSERIDAENGYVLIKVRDPSVWKFKHRVIWEAAYGKIPKDSVVLFRDGNRQNVILDNLILVKKSVNAILNKDGLSKYEGDLKEITVRLAELKLETGSAQKRKKYGKKQKRKKRE